MTDPASCRRVHGGYCQRCDALVGLVGLHVTGVERAEAGLRVEVESDRPVLVGCPSCGVVAPAHGRQTVELIDAPCFTSPVRLWWRKRRFRCPEPSCSVTSFMEQDPQVALPTGFTLLSMETREFLALRAGRVPGWKHVRTVHDLGLLRVPSGRLEASDPFVMLGSGLVFAIPPGTYPVKVTIADVSDGGDGSHLRESYLSVIIHEGDPVLVENVRPEGVTDQQWLDAASAGEYFGIGVDAGTVGFADADAVPTSMPPGDWYEDVFDSGEDHPWFALMDSRDHLIPGSANVVMPLADNGENVVLSHSGWGDGFYPVLASYAADGTLLGVHIDLLVEEPEDPA